MNGEWFHYSFGSIFCSLMQERVFAIEYSIFYVMQPAIWNACRWDMELDVVWNKRGKYPIFGRIHGSGISIFWYTRCISGRCFFFSFFSFTVFTKYIKVAKVLKYNISWWFVCIHFCLLGKNSSANARTITKTHATMQLILFSWKGLLFSLWFWYGKI